MWYAVRIILAVCPGLVIAAAWAAEGNRMTVIREEDHRLPRSSDWVTAQSYAAPDGEDMVRADQGLMLLGRPWQDLGGGGVRWPERVGRHRADAPPRSPASMRTPTMACSCAL